ncbi:MAG: AAA family ATPase [Myxococcales bacterium]|nr:AAA family ATPase [Myxococcales bacterium]
MTRRITIASQKGGTGKTTVSLNLGLALAERGLRTLIVDLDPQGGIGHSLRQGDTDLAGVVDVLVGAVPPEEATKQTRLPTLSLLPRGRLDAVDACEFERAIMEEGVLDDLLKGVESTFDIVLMDTPSGLGMPTRAAFAVSDFVLLPLQCEPLALRTIDQALRVVEHVREHENAKLTLLGLLPTMVDRDNEPSLNVLVESWRSLGTVLETNIPRADVFISASETGLPLAYLGGIPSPESRRFELLATEVEALMEQHTGKESRDAERPQRQLV